MKVIERIVERRLRKIVKLDEMQVGFMSGRDRRADRNSQFGGCFGGLGALPPATGGTGVWGHSPQRSKILHFLQK